MRSMRTPEGGSSYRVRGHQEGAELFSLFTFYVNTPKGAVVTKQVPINTNLSLLLGWNTVFRCSLRLFPTVLFRHVLQYTAHMAMGHGHEGAAKAP